MAAQPNWPAPTAPTSVHATVAVPGSKSLTNRTLILSALGAGPSTISGALRSDVDLKQPLASLASKAVQCVTADAPIELGVTDGVRDEVLARFEQDPEYAAMIRAAFPELELDGDFTLDHVVFALASFLRTMNSGDSPYDRYLAGDDTALTEQQKLGMSLFNGERFECFHCHRGTQLSVSYRDWRTPLGSIQYPFFNDGLYNVDGQGGYPAHDQGLYELTLNPAHRGLFRPPSLRNVALTAPYMHDGSIATLREVVMHYAAGGRLVSSGSFAGDGRVSPLKSGLIRGFAATELRQLADSALADAEILAVEGEGAAHERRHQDVVGFAPVRLVGVGRKQSIAGKGAYPPQGPSHQLVETFLVAEFVHQIGAADDHKGHAHHVEPVDRTEFPGHPRQTLERRGCIHRQRIAEHRLRRRLRDRAQSVARRHLG